MSFWIRKCELNPDLENVKCFISKYNKYNEAHSQGAEIIREWYPTMKTVIRNYSRCAQGRNRNRFRNPVERQEMTDSVTKKGCY